ncbi:mannitol-1-phosphate 5-dehydrogenase [Escherichia coli]|nr:mannitol-1-phosphate 5-dehydrogenase [Escherichia coli]KDV55939.1 mannitol-1-phosphate 5-dehydrogenase [Escherichia coli O45:H2 str. 2010C-4211]AQV49710.1 mannitol-1-phosphate 5-dehydrogenase [Escherichia coli]AQV60287.1 mannitol-1-phosphate 5-dehydrogenase [Escherichia coli]AQV65389.1 mannitol-1-phosphate 5-dehydrogenase [Escherichia coli]
MPDATLTRLIMPTSLCRTVGRIRRSRRIRQSAHNA